MTWSEVAQSCPTLCDPMDCSLPGSSVHGIFPGNGTGMDCHFLLQGIFLTQGSNLGLPHCRQMLYRLSHQGSPGKNDIICFKIGDLALFSGWKLCFTVALFCVISCVIKVFKFDFFILWTIPIIYPVFHLAVAFFLLIWCTFRKTNL